VRGFNVTTTVPLMPGLSQKFTFGAPWLHEHHGDEVKLFFNPFIDAPAKVVLAGPGTVLGDADMIDRQARYNLRRLGYGAFPDIGLAAARSHAQSLRRHVQAIRPDGRPGVTAHEVRASGPSPISDLPSPRRTLLAGRTLTPEARRERSTQLSRQADIANRLRAMVEV
jgi:hypothetical protein